MSGSYSAILSDTVRNLDGIEITQVKEYLSTYFVLEGVPYRFTINPHDLRYSFDLSEVEGLGLISTVLESNNKDLFTRVKRAYKGALHSYLIDVFNKRNAEYLEEPLKNYLFNHLLTIKEN